MFDLVLVLGATVVISVIARLLGSSRKLAVLVALIPTAIQGLMFSTAMVIVRDSDGEKIPKWMIIAQSAVLPLILAIVAAALVKKKEPNHTAEPASPGRGGSS